MIRSTNELARSNRELVAEMMATIAKVAEEIRKGNEQIALNKAGDERRYNICESKRETQS
jgi:hypothetical protein